MDKLSQDNGFRLSSRVKTTILEYLGPPWPYFLQIFLAEIKNRQDRENIKSTPESIKRIYHEHMVFGPKNKYLSHMFGRLREIFPSDELRLGRAVLKECAQKPAGITRSDIQRIHRRIIKDDMLRDEEQMGYVMDVLKHDGYLIQDIYGEQKIRFFFNMLRDYWKKTHPAWPNVRKKPFSLCYQNMAGGPYSFSIILTKSFTPSMMRLNSIV